MKEKGAPVSNPAADHRRYKMSWDFILQLISSNLFPIAACIAMALYFNKMNENYRADIKEVNASHKDEMAAMTEAVNNNTAVIQRLIDKMEG